MGAAQVVHMNVIANAGPIRRRIIGAEHGDGLASTERRLQHERNQMRFGIVVLADAAVFGTSGHVEVT